MKLQELLSPYRELAEMRRTAESDILSGAFQWTPTPEGKDFWQDVYHRELPEIPASSLAELAEWQKSKLPEANPHHCPECNWQCSCSDNPCSCCHETTEITSPTLIGGKTDTEWIYLFAGQAMHGVLSNPEMTCENIALEAVLHAKALLTQLKKEVENV